MDGECHVDHEWHGRIMVLSVSGSVDMATAPGLERNVAVCLAEEPAAMIVDLTETEFLASAGLATLTRARAHAGGHGIGFGVVADDAATSRPIQLVGLSHALNLHKSLDDALASVARHLARK